MSLIDSYKEFLVTKLFRESLLNKEILSPDKLEEKISEYKLIHKDFSLPKSNFIDFSVEKGFSSSVELIHTISESVSQDLTVISKEIYNIADLNNLYYSRWLKEIERLNIKAKKIEDRIDSLLLLENDSFGYYASIIENFSDFSKVDTSLTTALLDVSTKELLIERGSENSGSLSQLNTNSFTNKNISFYPLSKKKNTTYKELSAENSIVEVFRSENTSWIGEVTSSVNGEMLSELKISFPSETLLSRLVLNSKISSSNNQTIISLQYSSDGYNWFLIPVSNATQVLSNNSVSWNFPELNCSWIKFIFNKTSPDFIKDNLSHYRYSIESIRFYNNKYFSSRGSEFYSSSLFAKDNVDEIISFSKVTLDTCEYIPSETTVNYFLSASKDNSVWTDWKEIAPIKSSTVFPKVLVFSGLTEKKNSDTDISLLNSSYSSDQIVSLFDNTNVSQYKFKDINFGSINTRIPFPDNNSDLISNTVQIWRNLYKDGGLKVRETPVGWSSSGERYSCYFEIFSQSGKVIDFGSTICLIDGQEKTSIVTIPQGIHKFETSFQNWFDISDSLEDLILTSESTLSSIDPLYPYNHKLLINGIDYPISFEGEKKYLGTDLSAEFYSIKTSLFNLETNPDLGFNYFSIQDASTDSSTSLIVIVKFDSTITDYPNESFLLKWKEGEDSLFKYLKTKIILDTSNNFISPSVSSYRIKLGI